MLKVNEEWKQDDDMYKCPTCDKKYSKKGISTHIWRVHGDGKAFNPNIGYNTKNRVVWNKGLTKESSEIVNRIAITNKNNYASGIVVPHSLGRKISDVTRDKIRNNPKCGGYKKGSGRGKSGWYKGYWCDSTYELCWLIYQLDNNVIPIRNKIGFSYIYNSREYKYYPDFIINNVFYEIKGYETEKDLFKYKAITDRKLIVLKKPDLMHIFEYVNKKYTRNYITLYDK